MASFRFSMLAIDETRSISYNLRPFRLDRLGLRNAAENLIRSVDKASGVRFSYDIADIDQLLPEDQRINFYRIIQESLNNIVKHSHGTQASVRVKHYGSRILLVIQDNGRGFSSEGPTPTTGQGGFGLTGMAERTALLGGILSIRSDHNRGTIISVEIPIMENERG